MARLNPASTYATFNYVDPAALGSWDRRFRFDPAWSGIPALGVEMEVIDATELEDAPRLGREGFEAVTLSCGIPNSSDAAGLEEEWCPAIEQSVLDLTGADAVAVWGVGARFSERDEAIVRSDTNNPARRVHGDFAPTQFAEDVAQTTNTMAREAIQPKCRGRKLKSWSGLNVWQSLGSPPYDTPLGLCDVRTVEPEDLVIGKGSSPSMPDFEIDLPLYAYSERHRWYYWSSFTAGETLVFCGIDSRAPGNWRMVPHSAFDSRDCPDDAPPRASVEARCLAMFFA